MRGETVSKICSDNFIGGSISNKTYSLSQLNAKQFIKTAPQNEIVDAKMPGKLI